MYFLFQGGMRAVIWTDVFQTFVMITGLITTIAIGTNHVGGFSEVIRIAKEGKRFTFFKCVLFHFPQFIQINYAKFHASIIGCPICLFKR